jgi:ABC-type transporter Mla subunit MlaD
MQATTHAPARQGGLLRRLRRRHEFQPGDDLSPSVFGSSPEEIIDLRGVGEPELRALAQRVERLDAGVRLIVETMKKTYGDLAASIESLARQIDAADTRATVERIVAEEAGPLTASIRELSDAVKRLPNILAAAMDDLGLRVDSGRWKLEQTLSDGLDGLRQLASKRPEQENGDGKGRLAPRPFDLEPVEQQFPGQNGDGPEA